MLNHVPATQFHGPDALSCRQPAEDEVVEPYDEPWLEDIGLLITIPDCYNHWNFDFKKSTSLPYSVYTLPSNQLRLSQAENMLRDILLFLETLKTPEGKSLQARQHFLKKTQQFFLRDRSMYK
jgi:hypothetical protein